MAVQVVCYELCKQRGAAPVAPKWDRPEATMAQLEGLLGHLESVLESSGFMDPANPGQTMTRLRRLFTRVALDDTEVQMLRGILNQLATAGGPQRREGNSGPN
jgi:tRNA C32,U32 (ribose-2'-O)-methylase TrmJ